MGVKVTNNAFGTLSASITNSATTIVLDSGQGARFPTLGSGDFFFGTIIDTSNNLEIVKVTARSTDSMTVVRAQDNTTARAFAIGDRFELRPTAALFDQMLTDISNAGVAGITSSANATAMTIDSSERVAIGTTSPQVSPLTVHTKDQAHEGIMITSHDSGTNPTVNDYLGGIGWSGINDGANSLSAAEAKIVATAAETHSGSAAGTDLDFYTKERGTGPGSSADLNLRLRHSGKLIQYNRIGGATTDNTVDDGHVRREVHFTGAGTGSSSQATISRDVHFQVEAGFNRFSYVFIRLGAGSYSRPNGFEYFLWSSTAHAAGSAGHHGACYTYNHHGDAKSHIYRHKNFDSSYHNGSYYGWSSTPGIRFSTSTRTGSDAGIYCRIEGHGNHNGGTYNMGVVHSLLIRGIGNNNPTSNNFGVYLVGHSSPSDIGSYVGVS